MGVILVPHWYLSGAGTLLVLVPYWCWHPAGAYNNYYDILLLNCTLTGYLQTVRQELPDRTARLQLQAASGPPGGQSQRSRFPAGGQIHSLGKEKDNKGKCSLFAYTGYTSVKFST